MENPITNVKNEIIDWIKNLDDLEVLAHLLKLKEEDISFPKVSEPQMKYEISDDFEERFAKGLSLEESRAESKRKIREWWREM